MSAELDPRTRFGKLFLTFNTASTATQAAQAQFTRPMTITNIGSGNLDWNIFEDATTVLAGTLRASPPVRTVDLPPLTELPVPTGDNSWSTHPNPVILAVPPENSPPSPSSPTQTLCQESQAEVPGGLP